MIKKVVRRKLYQHPEKKIAYEERLKNMWPGLKALLEDHSIHKYSIFLDQETSNVFVYVEVRDEDHLDQLVEDPLVKKWWEHLSDLMFTDPDGTPMRHELKNLFDYEE